MTTVKIYDRLPYEVFVNNECVAQCRVSTDAFTVAGTYNPAHVRVEHEGKVITHLRPSALPRWDTCHKSS